MKWVAVLKSDQFVHRVVGLFDNELEAKTWIEDHNADDWSWYTCEFEEIPITD